MMLPLLLTIFLFSSSLALAPESIAGEKERGTIATLLVTPIGRGELALGKIFSLAILAFLCGMSSTLGTLLSLPKMMQMQGAPGGAMGMGLYGAKDYLLLAAVIFSTILFYVTAMSIVSAYAKSIKEAQNAITPLMIVVMVAGVSSMFGTVQERAALYLVPVYNSVQSMAGIFSFSYSPANVAIAVGANLAYSAVGALALTKMFNMEKVIFSR
jgi:sodium transport system permease protein